MLSNLARKSFHRLATRTFATLPVPEIKKVGCVGLGLMGHGIAQAAATNGFEVVAYEEQDKFLESGKSRISGSLSKMVQREKLTQDQMNSILSNIKYTTDASDLSDVDLVVEAVIENMDLKKDLYKMLNEHCKEDALFASNTSSLSITEMAAVSGRPDRFVAVHFFNPVQMMKLVEVIHTEHSDKKVFDAAFQWVKDIKKVPVSCGDTPGFIVNRLLVPALTQGMLMVDRGDATIGDIDVSMQLGAGHPMGPLKLADYIGLDTCIFIMQGWVDKYPDEPTFTVPKCLQEKVDRGELGRKTGKGFYNWDGDKPVGPA